jgi:hypothetical protein
MIEIQHVHAIGNSRLQLNVISISSGLTERSIDFDYKFKSKNV